MIYRCSNCVTQVPEKKEDSILVEAQRIVEGDRAADYGDAKTSFTKIADLATILTGREITDAEVCMVLIAMKLTRESFKHKRDNLVDLCGYAKLLNDLYS